MFAVPYHVIPAFGVSFGNILSKFSWDNASVSMNDKETLPLAQRTLTPREKTIMITHRVMFLQRMEDSIRLH